MRGGFWQIGSTYAFRGVSPNSTNTYRRGEGVKNPEIFAYVLNGSPLTLFVNYFLKGSRNTNDEARHSSDHFQDGICFRPLPRFHIPDVRRSTGFW